MSTKKINKGIRAKNVISEVMAVGSHAKAEKKVTMVTSQQISQAISDLLDAVGKLDLDNNAKEVIKEDINELKSATNKEQPDDDKVKSILASIAGKLKMVGVVISEANHLLQPIKKIAGAFGTALTFLGL